ncbi:Serine/threonine-protein kinase PknH [Posidoniimonas polymericola]|uniref:Serine/threonine-protein kinase PknH n=2 Tax=Posidoniimonas polymericola TaxID=2528002 RepID=A0A5C5YQL7_9BACT|nr:Serine/threonine-protein kinase PknH [Posidoniimonas polymericola]
MVGRMGPWQLTQVLAEGPLTRVYQARPADHPEAAPTYAIKALRREWWQDPTAIETMRREAWVGRQASSPNLVSVLSAQVTQPPFYVAMPCLRGEPLASRLKRGVRTSLPQTLWIARQVCQALTALNDQAGVIHADVKPSNIFIAPDGHVTLLDLGFCQTHSEAKCWASRPVVGTLNYIAPEMVTSACTADCRSDLYSLGATIYELLAGRPPFAADEPAELIALHRQAKSESIESAAPGTPKAVASLVHRLLAKDPLRRPNSPGETADELARLEIACFAYHETVA